MTIAASAQEAAAAAGVHKKTLMPTCSIEGGWVMYPITLCSVAMMWFMVDGFIKTGAGKMYPTDHVTQLRELFKKGDYVGAYGYAKTAGSPVADVVRAGVAFAPDGKTMTEEAILSEIARIQGEVKGRLSYLSVIGVCTPMVGLVGTVIGHDQAPSVNPRSGPARRKTLRGPFGSAIGEVLMATATGLIVAIPAFMGFFFLLINRLNRALSTRWKTKWAPASSASIPYHLAEGVHKVGDQETLRLQRTGMGRGRRRRSGQGSGPDPRVT